MGGGSTEHPALPPGFTLDSQKTPADAQKTLPLGDPQSGANEALANIGSSMIATPIAGLAGLAAGATRLMGLTQAEPADVVRNVQEALTYQPRTAYGQKTTELATYPLRKVGEFADYAGGKTADVTGSPAAGAAVNTGVQFLPSLLLKARGGKAPAPGATASAVAATPEAAAKSYVASRTSLDWNSLSDAVKTRITDIARDGETLSQLDPAAVERQARLESLPVPVKATRGQITRDPVQLRNEGNVSATTSGKPIRDVYVEQNKQLLQNLDVLKDKVSGSGATRSTAETPEQVGLSVQDAALRTKLKLHQQVVSDLYDKAEAAGELQAPVSIEPIRKLIAETPDRTHYDYVNSWINKMGAVEKVHGEPNTITKFVKDANGKPQWKTIEVSKPSVTTVGKELPLREIEDLRKSAVAKAMNGGEDAYYAGKLIDAIDRSTQGSGGAAYQAARAARKQQALEFQDQGAVARLVENKSRTDRATALEDTWRKTVLGGSIEDLNKVKTSLLTGGNSATRTAGRKAWNDIRAQTIQHITNEATKSVAKFEDGTPNVTPAAMERAIRSIGPQKLEAIFGQGTVRQLNQIMEATRDIKTEPPPGFKGSPTFANLIAFLEKSIGKVPVLGDTVTGAVRGAAKLREMGAAGREVRQATGSPLNDALQTARGASDRARNRNALADSVRYSVPAENRNNLTR